MKEAEAALALRYSHTEHLLKALSKLPDEDQRSVTHTDLVKRISLIRDAWKKAEMQRKAKQNVVLKAKYQKSKKHAKAPRNRQASKPTK